MDIRRLEHFIALIDHKQFNLAATQLKVSQQAVSKAISKLEEELGVTLFERSAYGVTPTEHAHILEQHARTILAESRIARSQLNALKTSRHATIALGVGPSLTPKLMPAAINSFRKINPSLGIRAFVDFAPVLQQRLLSGEIDLMVNAPPIDFKFASDLTVLPLFYEMDMLAVRASHPIAKRRTAEIADLLPYTWLAPRENRSLWQAVCRAYAQADQAPPSDVLITDSEQLKLGLLLDSDFVTIIDTDAMAQEIATGLVKCIHVEGLTQRRPAVIAHRKRGTLPVAAKTMITVITRLARQHVKEKKTLLSWVPTDGGF